MAGLATLDHPSLAVVHSVERGLPVGFVDEIAEAVAPGDVHFRHRLVPRSTLAKQRGTARLTVEQGDKVVRIARLWSHARRVWKSDAGARAFLGRSHPLLGDATPLDVALATTAGASLVEDVLGRLEYGTAI